MSSRTLGQSLDAVQSVAELGSVVARDWQAELSAPVSVVVTSLRSSDSPRVGGEDFEHIRALVESEGDWPAITVHRSTMRVIDGMHRMRAAKLRGESHIEARFFEGSDDDAFVLAVKSNALHGLSLSQVDRTAAAVRVVASHPHWSDRVIASMVGLSAKTVASIRRRSNADNPQSNNRTGRDGPVRPIDSGTGRKRASAVIAENPTASLRQIAAAAGIAVSTARDVRKRIRSGQHPLPASQRRVGQPEAHPSVEVAVEHRTDRTNPSLSKAPAPVLSYLKRDPSLRLNEVGRKILRLLEVQSLSAESWQQFAESVPTHCAHTVSDAARQCADAWLNFAKIIEVRGK